MKRNWSEKEKRATSKPSAKSREYDARRIADSAVRIAAMTDTMTQEERDDLWQREYDFALERLTKRK